MRGPAGWSDIPKLGGDPGPAVPGAAGGLSRREVHWYHLGPARAGRVKGTASEWLPSESPSAVVWTQQRLARAPAGSRSQAARW